MNAFLSSTTPSRFVALLAENSVSASSQYGHRPSSEVTCIISRIHDRVRGNAT